MKISELVAAQLGTVVEATYQPEVHGTADLTEGYTSDLLSDVIAHAPDQSVLVTMQAHKNTVACASLAGIRVLLLAHTTQVPDDMVQAARQEGVVLMASRSSQYQLTLQLGKLLRSPHLND